MLSDLEIPILENPEALDSMEYDVDKDIFREDIKS